jgi:DNA-binding MarR family transcriptional regulator
MADDVDQGIAVIEQQFAILLQTVRASLRDHAVRVHPQLQPVGYKVIGLLVRFGPLHPKQVAERLDTDKGLISRTVKELEGLGLLTRDRDPDDRRAYFLNATPEAFSRFDEISTADQRELYDRLRSWNPEEVTELGRLMTKLNDTFTAERPVDDRRPRG